MSGGQGLTEEQGRVLLTLARRTIGERLGVEITDPQLLQRLAKLDDPAFNEKSGTFVTLMEHGDLRGCIGNLAASESIREGIRRNAINAAFEDPRFAPLTADEFEQVRIEVSVLTNPIPLDHGGGEDLLAKLTPGRDGVIIRQGLCSATFLPQVWEQLPEPDSFLMHLCCKACLPADSWQSCDLQVLTYQVQKFKEA